MRAGRENKAERIERISSSLNGTPSVLSVLCIVVLCISSSSVLLFFPFFHFSFTCATRSSNILIGCGWQRTKKKQNKNKRRKKKKKMKQKIQQLLFISKI